MPGMDWFEIAKYEVRARADLSASVTHWTRRRDGRTAFNVLQCIIRERRIIASRPEGGFIKGNQRATCFSEIPVTIMVRLFRHAENDPKVRMFLKWEPYGLSFWKPVIYQRFGGRPVLYLSEDEYRRLIRTSHLEASDAWRVVRFDYATLEEAVDFTHEREWRTPDVTVHPIFRGGGGLAEFL